MKNGLWNISMNKQLILSLFSIVLIALLIGSSLAVLTASIGNARMILRANVGDTIQKTILIKNINNETINLQLTATGDLVKDIKILDNNFTLSPGEEKNARFTIKVTKDGAFENQILVKFYSPSEQKGVALSSNIVVMVNSDGNSTDVIDDLVDNNSTIPDEGTGGNIIPQNINPVILMLSITGIVLLIFFVLLIVYYFKTQKNENNKNEEKSEEETQDSNNLNEEKVEKTKHKKRSKKK